MNGARDEYISQMHSSRSIGAAAAARTTKRSSTGVPELKQSVSRSRMYPCVCMRAHSKEQIEPFISTLHQTHRQAVHSTGTWRSRTGSGHIQVEEGLTKGKKRESESKFRREREKGGE